MPYTPLDIADYGLIGDCRSCALVGRNGSIDWLCWPRFDSPACFAALLGDDDNGRWLIAPADPKATVTRSYRNDGMVIETLFETATGAVALLDFMAIGAEDPTIVRIVEGRRGSVAMTLDLGLRFDYGCSIPWVTRLAGSNAIVAIAGPAQVSLHGPVKLHGRQMRTHADFTVQAHKRSSFTLSWRASHRAPPPPIDADAALEATEHHWAEWSALADSAHPYANAVKRSLLTLKALTFDETGGIVAAATTSLPEQLGGGRNWDYRFCWLRDATLTLFALMSSGHYEEARAWRDWLHRSVAGSPGQIQIMYGIGGERQLLEWEVPWLAGYQGAKPVRIGNAASDQLQLDVYGEVVGALHQARIANLRDPKAGWPLQHGLMEHLETIWSQPDEGMWEVRGGAKHFVTSKAMCWMAFDRSIEDAVRFSLPAPIARWTEIRDQIHREVCEKGFSTAKNSFTQCYENDGLDASLLLLPAIGFLPADDPRIAGTIAAIEDELLEGGFVLRYRTEGGVDGLAGNEGAFLACSFWLADAYVMAGRVEDGRALFERLLALRNDLGLFSEEYDAGAKRMVGNFPQAFSHTAMISTASRLAGTETVLSAQPRG